MQKATRIARIEAWDKRAPKFGTKRGVSPYAKAFIEKLELPGDVVFDMGC